VAELEPRGTGEVAGVECCGGQRTVNTEQGGTEVTKGEEGVQGLRVLTRKLIVQSLAPEEEGARRILRKSTPGRRGERRNRRRFWASRLDSLCQENKDNEAEPTVPSAQ
jgi:hypothetical protein